MNCVYCGVSGELTDEHIVPAGLGGDKLLRNASCASCANATSRIELRVLRDGYGLHLVRSHLGIGKRRTKQRPKAGVIDVLRDGSRVSETLALAKHPLPLSLPLFAPPALTTAALDGKQIKVVGTHQYVLGQSGARVLAELDTEQAYLKVRNYDVAFARMIAKIALCSWLAVFGDQCLAESWLPAMILGKRGGIGRAVGSLDYALRGFVSAPCLHSVHMAVRESDGAEIAIARVQLFLQFTPSPTYAVNIGTLKKSFIVDPVLRNWWLPPQGVIGRPIISPLPRWVGTTLYGTPYTKGNAETNDELRAIGLVT